MSVTFWCPEAPREYKRVPCDAPSMGLTCEPGDRCGYCDDGWMEEKVTECPEVDLANANARQIVALLQMGDPNEEYGDLKVEDIPSVLRRIMVVLAKDGEREHLVRETFDGRAHEPRMMKDPETGMDRISCGPRVIDMGNTDAQTVRRVTNIRNLLTWAHEQGLDVSWG